MDSNDKSNINDPIKEEIKCLYPGKSKLKMSCNNGIDIVNSSIANAITEMSKTAMFFSRITEKKFLVSDNDVRIKNTFPIIKDEKAMALISFSECPSLIDRK